MIRKVLLFSAALALTSVAMNAAVISHTYNYGPGAAPFNYNFNLDLFDSNLGTLTGVKLTLNASSVAQIDIFNGTSTNQNFTNAQSSIPVTVTGPASTSVNFNLVAILASGVVVPNLNSFAGIPGNNSQFTDVNSVNFGAYQAAGGGTAVNGIVVSASSGSFSGTANPGVFFGGSATANGSVVVEYSYDVPPSEVPEPGTYAMLGSGLVLLGVYRRRRA